MGKSTIAPLEAAGAGESPPTRAPRRRRRVTVVSVVGELFLTAGVVLLLFVVWQLWIGDRIIGAQKAAEAEAVAQEWQREFTESAGGEPPEPLEPGEVPVLPQPMHGETIGIMYVPRFGEDWRFSIAAGVTRHDILDEGYIGHYPDTAMPGDTGNTAYAAHRWTAGSPFDPIDKLVVGDAIVIETRDGWYTYRFRTLEYVQDTEVSVLAPVPQRPELSADGRYLTLTSCAPKLNVLERIIAYAVFEEFTPRADGPLAALDEGNPA